MNCREDSASASGDVLKQISSPATKKNRVVDFADRVFINVSCAAHTKFVLKHSQRKNSACDPAKACLTLEPRTGGLPVVDLVRWRSVLPILKLRMLSGLSKRAG
jgi:hypothetical protein